MWLEAPPVTQSIAMCPGWSASRCLLLLCVTVVGADVLSQLDRLSSRLDGLQRKHHRPHRHHLKPVVPEPPDEQSEEDVVQTKTKDNKRLEVERLWDDLVAGMQSDQPTTSWSDLKKQMSSRAGLAKLRQKGPEAAFQSTDGLLEDQTELMQQANQHVMQIYLNYTCDAPVPQLVQVARTYPTANRLYVPSSVLLQRCSDSTGCCRRADLTCTALQRRTVYRAFLVKSMEPGQFGATTFQQLKFSEDVSCQCVPSDVTLPICQPPASEPRPADQSSSTESDSGEDHSEHHRHRSHHRHHSRRGRHKAQRCHCPEDFVSRPFPDGSCKCDCFDGDRKCTRVKRGKAYLDEEENRCILRGRCDPPDCTYGTYRTRDGRCPRRHERYVNWLNYVV